MQLNSISKFPQAGVDEAINCTMHNLLGKSARRNIKDNLHQ